jgi:hypothetical protein
MIISYFSSAEAGRFMIAEITDVDLDSQGGDLVKSSP